MIGKLMYWNHERGFGFIARDNNKAHNLFIHAVALPENVVPKPGDMIECDVQVNDADGRDRAANAKIVS